MARHLFLTGEKRVGKSTLLKKLLDKTPGPAGGFVTVKSDTVFPGRVSLRILRAGIENVPAPDNFLLFCGAPDGGAAERFDRLGCAALTESEGARLLVMDELGPHEADALAFRAAVLHALDGDIPILGVLQKANSAFLKQIAEHSKVKLVAVTPENRDTLAAALSPIR